MAVLFLCYSYSNIWITGGEQDMVYIPESSGFLIGIILGCLIVGALYGLIPFFVGRRRDMNGLGAAGLICSMLGNLFFMGWGFFAAGDRKSVV